MRRAGGAVLRLGAVYVLVVVALEVLPGDAAQLRAGPYASADDVQRIREEEGLDAPVALRALRWAVAAARGDLGTSAVSGRPVAELLGQRLEVTVTLAVLSLFVAIPLAVAAVIAARRWTGVAALVTSVVAVPQLVLAGTLSAILAGWLGWVPSLSLLSPGVPLLQQADRLVLPVLSLALPSAAFAAVLLRGVVEDLSDSLAVRDARLRGVPGAAVATGYLAPELVAPVLHVVAVVTGGLLGGTALVESVFGLAGIGELLVSAAAARDSAVVQASVLAAASVVIVLLSAADAVHDVLRPSPRAPVPRPWALAPQARR